MIIHKPKFNKKGHKESHGFTIVELLIATTVFSVVLVIFLSAFVQISRYFYKGVNMANTQEVARSTVQDIVDDIRFSQNTPISHNGYFCVGNHRYRYMLHNQVGADNPNPYNPAFGGNFGLIKETVPGNCPDPATTPGQNQQELLGNGMQVNNIGVDQCLYKICHINLLIVFWTGDNKIFTSTAHPANPDPDPLAAQDPDARCVGIPTDTQYCATAEYDRAVLQTIE